MTEFLTASLRSDDFVLMWYYLVRPTAIGDQTLNLLEKLLFDNKIERL